MKKKKIKTVLIIGTLDTKAEEILFVEKMINKRGFNALIMDTGVSVSSNSINHRTTSSRVINVVSENSSDQFIFNTKEEYMNIVIEKGRKLINTFQKSEKIDGVLGIGGGTGTSIATTIMQVLPRGFPKFTVSAIATGTTQFGPFVGTNDITIMHSIVDLQGINFITSRILSNAVGAICGMTEMYREVKIEGYSKDKVLIAMSMMGTTTIGALKAKENLEKEGFQVISFHQNGTGGIAMEEMIEEGIFKGVFDLSTHEVGDREVGGLHGAIKSIRLETAGRKGIPQVVVPGCLVYFVAGPVDSLPPEIKKRKYFIHSPEATLVRITPKELTHIGRVVAKKLNLAKGPVRVFIPLKGFCAPDKEGSELFDPEGNEAFIDSLKKDLKRHIPVVEVNAHINDIEFIDIVTEEFIKIMKERK